MSDTRPVNSPGKYVSPTAVGYSTKRGEFTFVTPDAPLPVFVTSNATTAPPPKALSGTATSSTLAGPYFPSSDVPMHLQIDGTWQGSVTLERSIDGGKTRHGLTAGGLPWARFMSNVNEPVWQESGHGTSFWLNIALESGELNYRLSQ